MIVEMVKFHLEGCLSNRRSRIPVKKNRWPPTRRIVCWGSHLMNRVLQLDRSAGCWRTTAFSRWLKALPTGAVFISGNHLLRVINIQCLLPVD